MSFAQLGLKAELVRAVSALGYARTTPIQAQAIPPILEGRDVLAGAQTGTGKTAAFVLPILQRLSVHAPQGRHPRALILTPTRELAAQIGESIGRYGHQLALRHAVIFGGVGFNPQADRLRRGIDILVATPGRLLDHVAQQTLNLAHIETLVLDEADRMLDMGFIHDIRKVLNLLPKPRQNLLFSATYSDQIRALANGLLHQPVLVEVARRNTTAELVEQVLYRVDREQKRAVLSHLVRDGDWRQVLVFTRTKHGANRLSEQLQRDGISTAAIHGNKSQNARTKALADFKSGAIRVLVATDIAARGLDIGGLPHVVNYELPNVAEDYVHRIGRTGRAGAAGSAVSLVDADELPYLAAIGKLLKQQISLQQVAGFEPDANPRPNPPPQARHRSGPSAAAAHRPGANPRRRRAGGGPRQPA